MDRKLQYHVSVFLRQVEKKPLWHNAWPGIDAGLNKGQDLDFLGVLAQQGVCLSGAVVLSGPAPVSLTIPSQIGGIPRHNMKELWHMYM